MDDDQLEYDNDKWARFVYTYPKYGHVIKPESLQHMDARILKDYENWERGNQSSKARAEQNIKWLDGIRANNRIRYEDGETRFIYLGSFECSSGEILVCDPGYEDTSSEIILPSCMKGIWHSYVEANSMHMENYKLFAIHETVKHNALTWSLFQEKQCGVDSGIAGFYDAQIFKYNEEFYQKICRATERMSDAEQIENKQQGLGAWAFDRGAVASTVNGDGGYNCYILKEAGTVCGAGLVFFIDNWEAEDYLAEEAKAWKGVDLAKLRN